MHRGAERTGTTLLAVGFLVLVIGEWMEADSGGEVGADIGAGLMILLGTGLGSLGLFGLLTVLLLGLRAGR